MPASAASTSRSISIRTRRRAPAFPSCCRAGRWKGQADAVWVKRLKDKVQRAKIKEAIAENIRVDRGGGDAKNVQIASCAWEPSLAGQTLADVTTGRGAAPTIENAAETVMWLVERGGAQGIFHAIGEEDLLRILASPWTMIGSDGDPDLRQGVAPSAQLRHLRARARRLRARKANPHARRRGEEDVVDAGGSAGVARPRPRSRRVACRPRAVRSGRGQGHRDVQ